jgi:hypothetical protein
MRCIFFIILLVGFGKTCAQNRTVYVIKNDSVNKPVNFDKSSFWDDFEDFNQFGISFPLRINPEYGAENGNNATQYLPDGLSIHGGMGWHISQAFALTANTGFDWQVGKGLFSVPVYTGMLLNISVNDEESILLQYGYGHAFAIGHGRLNGTYQKFRIGYHIDILGIFAEINNYGYPWKDEATMSTINLGVSVFVFR